ncbi:MAG: tetratricopeptide repeat-containing sensor histidine kinase [Breznakibacter sp.]
MKKAFLLITFTASLATLFGQTNGLVYSNIVSDSIMVSTLINQSTNNFANNKILTPTLDLQLEEALLICQKSGLMQQEAYIFNLVGKRERQRSNFASAIKYCSKAVQIAEQLQDPKLLAEYNNQLGVVFRRVDENILAINAHMKALKYAEQTNDTFNISVSLNSIGNVKISLQQNNTAIEYFRRSIDLSEKISNTLGLAMNFNNIGEAYLNMKMTDSALHYFQRSLDYNERINSQIGQAINFTSIGNVYLERKEYNKALDYLNKALVLHTQIGDLILLSVTHTNLGKAFLKTNNTSNAIFHLEKALEIATSTGSKFQATESSALLAELYEATGNYAKAFSLFKLSSQFKDSLINEKNLQHMATMELIYHTEKKDQKIQELNLQAQDAKEKLYKQNYLIFFLVSIALLSIIIILLVFYQFRLKTHLRSIRNKQRLLRLQMNPHFVFNALNALQLYILENDQEKSSKLLSSFSKLMRNVLQSSNFEYISIKEESELILDYLSVQQLRFWDPFNYQLIIDDELKVSNTAIPPMLTQPFIENAIEHGFLEINSSCYIEIRIYKHEKSTVIEISDNGIGIESADKSTHAQQAQHQSMATKITKERLMVLQKESGKRTSIEIIDKSKLSDQKGTLVRITIPQITIQL